MGREHLSPAVGDLDGDGDLNLLVGERVGKLTWYENKGNNVTVEAGVGQHGEQFVEGDILKRGGGGGKQFPLQIGTEWRQFQQKFSISKTIQASKDQVAHCWVYFHLNNAQPDGYFDVTDVVLEETTPLKIRRVVSYTPPFLSSSAAYFFTALYHSHFFA